MKTKCEHGIPVGKGCVACDLRRDTDNHQSHNEKIQRGAKDFAERFEGVMKEETLNPHMKGR